MTKVEIVFQECEKVFLAEGDRTKSLGGKAEKLIAAVGAIMGFKLIEIEKVIPLAHWQIVYLAVSISAFVILGISLILALWSLSTRNYEGYPRGNELIDELKGQQITADMARGKIAGMYLLASENNASINDEKAKLLGFCVFLMVLGFALAIGSKLFASVVN